jgi:hypothetical protein
VVRRLWVDGYAGLAISRNTPSFDKTEKQSLSMED